MPTPSPFHPPIANTFLPTFQTCEPPEQQAQLTAIAEAMLGKLTAGVSDAEYICRLCDETARPQDCCLVHQAAMTRAA